VFTGERPDAADYCPSKRREGRSTKGGPAREDLARVVKAASPAIRACYEDALRRLGSVAGRLTVRAIVAPAGHIYDMCLEDVTFLDAPTVSCVLAALGAMEFAPSKVTTTLILPIHLVNRDLAPLAYTVPP
jgi:hypothetical protein